VTTPRAKTKEEVREEFLAYIHVLADYWSKLPNKTAQERCDGMAFSILNIFDGTTTPLPAMNISLFPHPDDGEYLRRRGQNWFEPGMIINDDVMLHDLYYEEKIK